jgi:hypothetical protein
VRPHGDDDDDNGGNGGDARVLLLSQRPRLANGGVGELRACRCAPFLFFFSFPFF